MIRRLFTLFLLLLSFTAFTQSFTYRNYNVNQGLPSSQTYDVIQDKHNYIWIASDRGVSRFDGYTFKNYTTENGLLDNNVYNLYEDRFGRIWFLSYCGKISYYFNGKIHPFRFNNKIIPDTKRPLAPIRSFEVLTDSSILIGTMGNGAFKIDPNGNLADLTIYQKDYTYNYILQYNNNIFLTYSLFNSTNKPKATSIFINRRKIFEKIFLPVRTKNAFFLLRKNKGAIFTSNGLLLLIKNGYVQDTLSTPSDVISLYEDSDSCLWIGYMDGGVRRYAPNESFSSKHNKLYFSQNQITKVIEDHEHGFWLTTLYNGIIYVPNIQIENLDYYGEITNKEKTISLAHDFKSRIFVGTNKGTVKFYANAKLIHEIQCDDYIKTLFYDTIKKVLIISGNVSTNLYHPRKTIPVKGIGLCYLRDTNNKLLLGSYNGILNNFPLEPRTYFFSKREYVRVESMTYDANKKIWVGSFSGLYYLNGDSLVKKTGDSLFNHRVTSVISIKNALYFSTIDAGLVKMTDNNLKLYSAKNGLPSNTINNLLKLNDSIVWIATSKGACKFNANQGKVVFTLDTRKGLFSNEVKDIEVLNDTIYILTNEGVSYFKANTNFKNPMAPKAFIQDFRIDTISYMGQTNPVLKYSDNYLTFNVTGLNYKQSGNVTYHYRLKGYSETWRVTSGNNIQLAFVPPGTYTFEVLAENEDGALSEQPAIYQFTIKQPIWKRLWFQLLIILIIVSMVTIFLLLRIQRIKEKNKILEQLNSFKQQALTMQMNPHFIFNLLSSIQSYVLAEDAVKASKYIAMFAKLMRKSLDNSRSEFIPFEEEINTLKLYFELESLRLKSKTSFGFEYEATIMENILIPPMLIQPHLENTLKHAFIGFSQEIYTEVKIRFELNNKLLTCYVEDNGMGLNKAKKLKLPNQGHISAGLDVTKNRLELLCKKLHFPYSFSIKDKQEIDVNLTGTIVKFNIPYIYGDKSANS